MKLQFDSGLIYQKEAIFSVVDLFRGQTPKQSNFTVSAYSGQMGMEDIEHGIKNNLILDETEILSNLQQVQLRNGLPQSEMSRVGEYDFKIEMETGTGKTYVYLRSIFELNKEYGFTKFIVVVPSIAIKEGVYKSLQITKEHFANLYNNTVCDFFVYNSGSPEEVRNFAVNDHISIMVINIDAFRKSFTDEDISKKSNLIHRPHEKLNGMKPIELIQETNPIVIIDEPQTTDTTSKSSEAIASLNPLCIFRYSATLPDKNNLIYKLDAVDSFNLGIVKQIEVHSFREADGHNSAYMRLVSVDNSKGQITAKIEIDVNLKGSVSRKIITVRAGDDLYDKSNRRDLYENHIIDEIYCEKGNEYVSFSTNDTILRLDENIGGMDPLVIKEAQIRTTIKEHLDKELKLNKLGIKVLSLFFIDRVAKYRFYDDEGNAQKGIYAELFEKCYKDLIKMPKYKELSEYFDLEADISKIHNGYFSQDKKGVMKDTSGTTAADDDTYNTIMKEKEFLLSFDSSLRFIFSHSALREGWDNPNVFQICTLNETESNVKKRQELGRGLRLCVNQDGERQQGSTINTLTVMANENYDEFASKLQKEYEDESGIKFGYIGSHSFANIPVRNENGEFEYLGQEKSQRIYDFFIEKGYINAIGKTTDVLKGIIDSGQQVEVPSEVIESIDAITAICAKVCGGLKIKNAEDKKTVKLNKERFLSPEFKELWDKIKYKTTYRVDFSSEELIEKCCKEMEALDIKAPQLLHTKAKINVSAGGVEAEADITKAVYKDISEVELPDIITYMQNKTNLTRKTIVEILIRSGTLDQFKLNPQKYMEEVSKLIKAVMNSLIVDGIKYTRVGEDYYYAQELFENEELTGYLEKNMLESKSSVYEYVVYDSNIEKTFAENFEKDSNVLVYAKLPGWFKINTPLGGYNPDWAVLIDDEGQRRLYFVVETKGNLEIGQLRANESDKIKCGEKHFEAIGNEVKFAKASNYEKFVIENT